MALKDRFTVQTITSSTLVNQILSTGDFNGDGLIDIVFGRYANDGSDILPITLGLSKPDGTYSLKTLSVGGVNLYVVTGDFNGDGKVDIAIFDRTNTYVRPVGGYGKPPQLLLGDGTGSFSESKALANAVAAYPGGLLGPKSPDADLHLKDVTTADIDGDGDLDFWIESAGGDNILNHFMINNGDGTFTVDEARASRLAIWGDRNKGEAFRYQIGELVDVNGDGKPDLLLGQIRDNEPTHINQYSIVIYNDGKGYFPLENRVNLPHPDFYYGYTAVNGMAAGDLNGDGLKDLLVVHTRNDDVSGPQAETPWVGRYVQILIGKPDGSFVDETKARIGDQALAAKGGGDLYNNPRQVMIVDLDQDGDLDLITAGNGTYWRDGSAYAYLNDGKGVFTASDGVFYTDGQAWYGEGGYFIDLNGDGRQDFVHIDIDAGPNKKFEGNNAVSDDVSTIYFQTATTRFVAAQTASNTAPTGSPGDDTLTGTASDDTLALGNGNDRVIGLGGNDTIDGGAGYDTAVYADRYADVSIKLTGSTISVTTKTEGVDTLTNIEALRFADQTVTLAALQRDLTPTSFSLVADTGFAGSIGGSGRVVGTTGAQDITVGSRAGTVSFDPSFNAGGDIIRLPGKAADWTIQRTGSSAKLVSDAVAATIPIGTTANWIVFSDGARSLAYKDGSFKIGSQSFAESAVKITAASEGAAPSLTLNADANGRLILSEGAAAAIGGKVQVIGTSAGKELVEVLGGKISFDPSFNGGGDVIDLPGNANAWSAVRSGSSMLLSKGSDSASIPIGTAGTDIAFDNATRALIFAGGQFKIGTQVIEGSTPAALLG